VASLWDACWGKRNLWRENEAVANLSRNCQLGSKNAEIEQKDK
jgi:hypothetical protein